jgi:hypothetical protein
MEVNNILIDDTNGVLSEELFKSDVDKTSLSAWFSTQDERTLKMSANNVRYNSIPNINGSTYITFLAYNGTLGYSNKVFSTVLVEDSGIFNVAVPPILEYNPGEVTAPLAEELEDVVIDIKMYNGTVDVLQYREGYLDTGEKTYKVKSIRSYPTTITKLPNVYGNKVSLDGWYSYTQVVFRNISPGDTLIENTFYGYEGFIFKASQTGIMYKDTAGNIRSVQGLNDPADAPIQVENTNYEEILFSLNETEGMGSDGNSVYLHSQVLITEEIRDAIVTEVIEASKKDCSGCDFADWQKLTMKRAAAAVYFENGLYEQAQIIIESSRAMCTNQKGGC